MPVASISVEDGTFIRSSRSSATLSESRKGVSLVSTRKTVSLLFAVFGILADVSAHGSVIYTGRISSITGQLCNDTNLCAVQTQSSTDFSPFSGSFSDSNGFSDYSVSQNSAITANQISVSMSASQSLAGSAQSHFEVDFSVDAPTNFTMTGKTVNVLNSTDANVDLSGPVSFGLLDVDCRQRASEITCEYNNQNLYYPGYSTRTLAVGAYKLFVDVSTRGLIIPGDDPANANFTMNFAPVPIPGAIWLFASGIATLGWRIGKKRLF
jgi:hypothetical protein